MSINGRKLDVVVSVDDDHLEDFPEVVRELEAIGMEVRERLSVIGTVTGSIDRESATALASVEGVSDVEPARSYALPDPESPVQ